MEKQVKLIVIIGLVAGLFLSLISPVLPETFRQTYLGLGAMLIVVFSVIALATFMEE
ncbi:MAG: hypothetical protein SVV03_00580 [Candidatus Nanohaloarchaea archaeon]|nr:hypothetical protein [Candidatus Nanohaloarchaea archaeon]